MSEVKAELDQGRTAEEWTEIRAKVAGGDRDFVHPREHKAMEELRARHGQLLSDPYFADQDRLLWACLFARKLDVDRTAELLSNHLAFRQKFDCVRPRTVGDVDPALMASGYSFSVPGTRDKTGRSVGYIFLSRYVPKNYAKLAQIQHTIWWFEQYLKKETFDAFREGVTYVEDISHAGMKNVSVDKESKAALDAFQNSFPLRIRSILVVDPGFIVRLLLKIARFFVKEKIIQRTECITRAELHQRIDSSQLIRDFGGENTFDYNVWLASLTPQQAVSEPNQQSPPHSE